MIKKNESALLKRKRVTFKINTNPGSAVFVTGDFNNWDESGKALKDSKGNGSFSGCLMLEPGVYEYKFVIDGNWIVDPSCPEQIQNSCGTYNSVLRVK